MDDFKKRTPTLIDAPGFRFTPAPQPILGSLLDQALAQLEALAMVAASSPPEATLARAADRAQGALEVLKELRDEAATPPGPPASTMIPRDPGPEG